MRLLYSLMMRIFIGLLAVSGYWNKKNRRSYNGRKTNGLQQLLAWSDALPKQQKIYWFHCASLGEYEQGLPLIELLRKQHPQKAIALTFFSPSGFENYKSNAAIDWVGYLPFDTQHNASLLAENLNAEAVFFVKYEFWYNLLAALHKKGIKTFLVSGFFHKRQPFFKWYGGWFKAELGSFTHFFVQDAASHELLRQLGYQNATVSGDTRFDRVKEIASRSFQLQWLDDFCKDSFVVVAGSTWPADEAMLLGNVLQEANAAQQIRLKHIIAPHEIAPERIASLVRQTGGMLWSAAMKRQFNSSDTLIVDSIGQLSALYRYADIAYIGGGFGSGIHNVLEAAVYGKPILFGPAYQKYHEAVQLVELKGAFVVTNQAELRAMLRQFAADLSYRQKCGKISEQFVVENSGVAQRIYSDISGFCS